MADAELHGMTDQQLITLIKKDNQFALEVLFLRYYQQLCGFTFNYLKDLSLTEEVVSDVFFKVWEKRNKVNIQNVKAYLFTAAKNQAFNKLRSEKNEIVDFDEVKGLLEDIEYGPDHILMKKEFANSIEALINTLPTRRAQVFRLCRLEGFSYKEIAEILSISINTVQNHMVLAVKQLSKYSYLSKDK